MCTMGYGLRYALARTDILMRAETIGTGKTKVKVV